MRPTPHSFTRDAARRIARAVRTVEASMPPRLALQRPRKRAPDAEAGMSLDVDFLASSAVVGEVLRITIADGWVVVDPVGGKYLGGGSIDLASSGSLTVYLSLDRADLTAEYITGPETEFGYDADKILVPICTCEAEKSGSAWEVKTLIQHHIGALYVGTQI